MVPTQKEWMNHLKKKIRPHNRIAQCLINGDVVSPEEIEATFLNDEHMSGLLYRLSVYIFDIRKYDNGVVKPYKEGRKVVGYQLLNAHMFDPQGRWLGFDRKLLADAEVDSWGNGISVEGPEPPDGERDIIIASETGGPMDPSEGLQTETTDDDTDEPIDMSQFPAWTLPTNQYGGLYDSGE